MTEQGVSWNPPKYCTRCGVELMKPHRTSCASCRQKHVREYHREWERKNPELQKRREANPRRRRSPEDAGKCLDCKKPLDGPNRTYCRACMNARTKASAEKNYLKYRAQKTFKQYGITQENFDALLLAQQGRCAICSVELVFHQRRGADLPEGTQVGCIDHDHSTGAVRGMLCTPCNTAIGNLQDDITVIETAVAYLRKYTTHTGE